MAKPTGKQQRDDSGQVVGIAGKNANGKGSVYYVPSKGRWLAQYRDLNGKRRTVSASSAKQAEALRRERVAALLQAEAEAQAEAASLGTVAGLCAAWLDAVQVRPNTLATYRNHVRLICEDAGLGPLLVADLKSSDVRKGLDRLAGLYADDTIRNARNRLHQILEYAMAVDLLKDNVARPVKTPKSRVRPDTPKRTLTVEETARVVKACASHRLGAAVAILFIVGCRGAEALGLAWQDIDLEAGTAHIRRGSTFVGGGIGQRLDDPKTTSTAGVHHLSPSIIALLKLRREQQDIERAEAGDIWQSTVYQGEPLDMVFTNQRGGLTLSQKLYQAVREVCTLAGVNPDRVGAHTGRRTVVTALYASGVPLDDVARHVGHGSTATTTKYVMGLGTRPADTARRAAELLDPAATADD